MRGQKKSPPPPVQFVSVGPGDPELITLKAKRALEAADLILYTGSLTPRELVASWARPGARLEDSAGLHLEQILALMVEAARRGERVARVHDGDCTIFGALGEQLRGLEEAGVPYELIPGVSAVFAAAASLKAELTAPEISQTVILTRMEGRTPVPEKERLEDLAHHGCTIALYLSAALITKATRALLSGGYPPSTPAAVVYRASWPDEKVIRGTLGDIAQKTREAGIAKQAMILVGKALDEGLRVPGAAAASKLYDKHFSHGFRKSVDFQARRAAREKGKKRGKKAAKRPRKAQGTGNLFS
ncbi:MAG: precorrin-4 C(11)-methyltransferase [Nitrospinota bacterium]